MRLPVRQPVTQYARLNPLAGAVAEIRRSVMNFTGSQSLKFTSLITLTGDFEIVWIGQYPQSTYGGYFFAYTEGDTQGDRVLLSRSDPAKQEWSFGGGGLGYKPVDNPIIVDEKIHIFSLKRLSGVVTFSVDAIVKLSGASFWPDVRINSFGIKYQPSTGVPDYRGINTQIYIYKDGDRNTGNLVLDLPLNNAASDYQRNLAVPEGVDLLTTDLKTTLAGWNTYHFTTGSFNVSSGVFTLTGGDASRSYFSFDSIVGETYLVSVEILSSTVDVSLRISPGALANFSSESGVSPRATGYRVVQVAMKATTSTTSVGVVLHATGSASFKPLYLSKFAGGVMKNTLPADWKKIKRQKAQNFWTDSTGAKLEIAS